MSAALAVEAVPQPTPGTPGRRDAERTEIAVGALLSGLVALAASAPVSDNSLLTHIATGRLQAHGGLPRQNPFLVTSSDFPVPSWWWSAALGWTERALGLAGVRLLIVVVAGVLGWLVVRAARPVGDPCRAPRTALAQALPAAVVLALLMPYLNGRPHLPAFVLLAAALVVWRERRSPWWMLGLFAVWVNVHGTWLYGIAVLALLWMAEAIDDRGWHPERLRWAAGVMGGLVVGGIWYPERFRLVLLPTEQLGSPEAREAIRLYREWRPASAGSPWIWVLAVVVLLALYGAWRRGRAGSAIAIVVLAVMGAGALRLMPVAAITLAGFAAVGIAAVSRMPLPGPRVRAAMMVVGGLALAVALLGAVRGPHVDLERYPVEEVDWMESRGLVASPRVRVLHNDWVGNYLEYRYGSGAFAWVDDRPSVSTLLDYVRLRELGDGWEEALARADPDVVLWQAGDPLPEELASRSDWEVALTTERFRLLCRARIADRCR